MGITFFSRVSNKLTDSKFIHTPNSFLSSSSILNLPIVVTAKALSAKKAKDALASSTVKIAGRDVLATWKFLVGLVLIPLLYGLYTLIVFWICMKSELSWFQTILYPALTWTLLPFVSYASMRFAENGVDVFK